MDREDLQAFCKRVAGLRGQVITGRVSVTICDVAVDPVVEIIRSFRRAEISESEKNALLSLVCDVDEDEDGYAEMACIRDPYADACAVESDDDIG